MDEMQKKHTRFDFSRNKLYLKIFGIAKVLSDFERSRVQKYLSSYGHWRPNLLVNSFFGINAVTNSWATIVFWGGRHLWPWFIVGCFRFWLHSSPAIYRAGCFLGGFTGLRRFKMPGMACQLNRSWFE